MSRPSELGPRDRVERCLARAIRCLFALAALLWIAAGAVIAWRVL
jgi:hypothetical protein